MKEAIFSLLGVLLGGLISFGSTYFFEWKNKKYEERKYEKELVCNVIKQYEILSDKIWFNTYYQDDPSDIIKYISNEFIDQRHNNKEKELLFIKDEILKTIEHTDYLVIPFDEPYNREEFQKIKCEIRECIKVLRDYLSKLK